eukprot:TRINITY_DN16499_c0_g1_i1.p1 TRINITY_DN16499_c0_g1~~TRINITY_DN16499_c0_g1_i1.p1  ORF type:complete len:703 (-),score=92.66 TRINITY_DN16499_c0_g1_i1:191-2143(-)
MDADSLVHDACLPTKLHMQHEVYNSLRPAIENALEGAQIEFKRCGAMWDNSQPIAFDLGVMYYADTLDRALLMSLASAARHVLEPAQATVSITYAEELNPISSEIMIPRQRETTPLQDLFDRRFQDFQGSMQCVTFGGFSTTKTRSKKTAKKHVGWPTGLVIGTWITISSHSSSKREPGLDRLRRIEKMCEEGNLIYAARNIKQLIRGRSGQSYELRKMLSEEIDALARWESMFWLLHSAKQVIPDEDLPDYCFKHFGFTGMDCASVDNLISACRGRLSEGGKAILLKIRSHLELRSQCHTPDSIRSFEGIFNEERVKLLSDAIDRCTADQVVGMPKDPNSSWQFEPNSTEMSWSSPAFQSLDGDEDVLLIQLKHCKLTNLLRNIGLECDTPSYGPGTVIFWSSRLSPAQEKLKDLARKMCFKSYVPNSVIEGSCLLQDAQFQGAFVLDYLHQHKSLPFPSPSISPVYASGAIVFVNPAIARDVPDLVKCAISSGRPVGVGTLILSKSLQSLVMDVLNPGPITIDGAIVQAKNAAFVKARTVIDMPRSPAGFFRYQGILSARSIGCGGVARASEQPNSGEGDGDSLGSRRTRTTGDLPVGNSEWRPSECDWPHRQTLPGQLRVRLGEDGQPVSTIIHKLQPRKSKYTRRS